MGGDDMGGGGSSGGFGGGMDLPSRGGMDSHGSMGTDKSEL
jgi:hypothetical protein